TRRGSQRRRGHGARRAGMSAFLGAATEPEGRRGSQTQLSEGGRYLDTPENRPAAAATPPRLMAACSRRRRRPAAINPKPSPFFRSPFRGALEESSLRPSGRLVAKIVSQAD